MVDRDNEWKNKMTGTRRGGAQLRRRLKTKRKPKVSPSKRRYQLNTLEKKLVTGRLQCLASQNEELLDSVAKVERLTSGKQGSLGVHHQEVS